MDTLATASRTVVVTVLRVGDGVALSEQRVIGGMSRRTLVFLMLSGLATEVSWLAYFRALQMAPVSAVAPIDKLSFPFTILLAALLTRA
jgi:bacterial/archaeal transporter family protein